MQDNLSKKTASINLQSAKSKVIAAFILASVTLVLFWLGSRFVFHVALSNMEKLSKPNEKLVQVHALFQEFTQVDQLQRHIAIQGKQGRRAKISLLSDTLQTRIEALKELYQEEDSQYQRLDSIQQVMAKRGHLFWDFIQERDQLISSSLLVEQTQAITELIDRYEPLIDSSMLIKTYRQITKITTPPDTIFRIISLERQGNLFNRLFGKKKPTDIEEAYVAAEPEIAVEETFDSIVSNLALAQKDTIMPWLEEQLREMIEYHQKQAARMAWAELEFLKTSNALTNQILFMLYEIEDDELGKVEANQMSLSKLINSSFRVFNWLLIGILLSLAFMIFLILVDFSKSRQYRAQLLQAKEEAERLGQVKERFLSNMSHEIRTPLQSIIGFAEQMQKAERTSGFEQKAIHQSARHLLQIVNEILDYNRLVSGRFQLDAQPFDVREVLEEVSDGMKVQAESKSLDFVVDLDIEPGKLLLGDAFRLRQILYNLLGNAIKFTPEGRVSLSASLWGDKAGYHLQFRIADTGIGISKEGLKHIFNQFEQAPGLDHKRYGGTGLGLSIVKALVEIQGGDINAESTPDVGSQFIVSLQYPEAPAAILLAGQPSAQAAIEPARTIGSVFIVDDDSYTLRLCQQILTANQYKAFAFPSAAALLDAVSFKAGDLVLTDIRLPGISGYQLLEKIRAQGVPMVVVAMTAQALPEEQRGMRQAGFDKILVKPFSESELVRVVGCFLRPAAAAPPPTAQVRGSLFSQAFAEDEDLQTLFVEESKNDLEQLDVAIKTDDADAAADALHRLAGRSGQFGFTAWYQSLRRLEVGLRTQSDLRAFRPEIEGLREEIAGALSGL